MKKLKVLLATVIFVVATVFVSFDAGAARLLSANEMTSTLQYLQSNVYRQGQKWGESYKGKAWSCAGFAAEIYDQVFQEDWYFNVGGNAQIHGNLNNLHTGDIVRFNNGSTDHSIMILSVNGFTVTYVDANHSGDNKVYWNNLPITTNNLQAKVDKLLISAKEDTRRGGRGYVVHKKDNWVRLSSYAASAPIIAAPTLPTPTQTSFRTTDSINISWPSVTNAVSYKYYLTQAPIGYAYESNTRNGHIFENNITFTGLSAGRYHMFIHAVNATGNSPQSNWIEFVVDEPDYIPTKTMAYNGHQYSIYDYGTSWTYADELSKRMGGHLVTITSKEENDAVSDLIASGKKDGYWIGANNTDWNISTWNNSGAWKWVGGESFTYSNWDSGEPSGSGSNAAKEHFTEIRKSYGNKWNDQRNTNAALNTQGFILEIDDNIQPIATEDFGNNSYALFDKQMTWKDAKAYSESIGGHLVAVTSDAERQAVETLISKGKKSWYWIGATDEAVKGTFKWVTNEVFIPNASYVKWITSGNPKSIHPDGRYLMMYRTEKSWTALRDYYNTGNDMQYFGFICEFENVNKPLQSISLSEATLTLAVGDNETLTVDYDPIDTSDDKAIAWSSSDESVATVDDGFVIAHGAGEAIITARVGSKEATSVVQVKSGDAIVTPSDGFAITDIVISGESTVGQPLTFTTVTNDDQSENSSYTFYIYKDNKVHYFKANSSIKSFSYAPISAGTYTAVILATTETDDGVLYTKDFVIN